MTSGLTKERFELHLDTVKKVGCWLAQRVPQHSSDIHSVCRIALMDVLRRHGDKTDDEIAKIAKRAARNQGIQYLIENIRVVRVPLSSYSRGVSSPVEFEETPLFEDIRSDVNYDPEKSFEKLLSYCKKYIAEDDTERTILELRAEGIPVVEFAEQLGLGKSQVFNIIKKLRRRYKEQRNG
jgi:DNA-directed RNA polymerase specialized sigma subunit